MGTACKVFAFLFKHFYIKIIKKNKTNKMKVLITISLIITCFCTNINAQTAMQISGVDCYGEPVDKFADLDAGKAIILHFYMPDCGACPPPADKMQEMATNIMVDYPDMVKGYAFPFQDITTCDYSISWVEDNHLPFFAPMDSGEYPVAYYGGFGMPTVVLLGGADHRVMFTTLSFITSDTTEMRDSILNMLGAPTDILNNVSSISNFNVYPNPANEILQINVDISMNSDIKINILDITGKLILEIAEEKNVAGNIIKQVNVSSISEGIYLVKLTANGNSSMKMLTITH